MKKLFGLFILALAFLAPQAAQAANCFWVGGTGNLNDTTKWMTTSGGATPCAATGGWPNSRSDTATFDASSGGGTITRNANWTVGSITLGAFTGTLGNSGDTTTVDFNSLSNTSSGTRTFNLGASTWTCGNPGTTACGWNQGGATNLTFNANTSTLVFGGSLVATAQVLSMGPSGTTYNNVTINPDQSGNVLGTTFNAASTTIANLTIGAPNYIQATNGTVTITGTLAFTGGTPSLSAWTAIWTTSFGNNLTFALSANPATCNYCVLRDVTATTNAITANNSISLGHLTNVTVSSPTGSGGGGSRGIIGG